MGTKKTRRSKGKTADFQKTKLKVGRKVQKANDTKVTFRSKQIVLADQLRTATTGFGHPLSSLRPIKELFCRLSHHNVHSKVDGCRSLRDRIIAEPSLIRCQLGPIIGQIIPLLCSDEPQARRAALALMQATFERTSAVPISAHFPSIAAGLRLAFTHVLEPVQLDSCQFLQLVVSNFTQLAIDNCSSIFVPLFESLLNERHLNRPESLFSKPSSRQLLRKQLAIIRDSFNKHLANTEWLNKPSPAKLTRSVVWTRANGAYAIPYRLYWGNSLRWDDVCACATGGRPESSSSSSAASCLDLEQVLFRIGRVINLLS